MRLGYNDQGLSATWSGGSWSGDLTPANQLANRFIAAKARTTSAAALTLTATLAASTSIDVVAIAGHNLTLNTATVRVQAGSFDSGAVTVAAAGSLPFLTPVFCCLLPAAETASSVQIDIADTGNADGYLEIGRVLIMQDAYPFTRQHIVYPAYRGWADGTQITESLGGFQFPDQRPPRRMERFTLDGLTAAMEAGLWGAAGTEGLSGEVLFIHDQTQVDVSYDRMFLGRLRRLNELEMRSFGRNLVEFEVGEVF